MERGERKKGEGRKEGKVEEWKEVRGRREMR